jgi:hypothetical protein
MTSWRPVFSNPPSNIIRWVFSLVMIDALSKRVRLIDGTPSYELNIATYIVIAGLRQVVRRGQFQQQRRIKSILFYNGRSHCLVEK